MPPPFPWSRPPSLAAFGSALRRQRESLGLTLDTLAQATGISKPYLSNIETARAPGPPSEEKLELLAAALRLPAKDLLTGADWLRTPPSIRRALTAATTMTSTESDTSLPPLPRRPDGTINLDNLLPASDSPSSPPLENPKSKLKNPPNELPLRPIPLINRVPAGPAAEFTDLSYPAGIADQYIPVPDLPDAPASAAFALRVTGDSMAPDYLDGDILIVAPPAGTPADGTDCVVRLGELDHFATTFKRIYFVYDPGAPVPPAEDTQPTPPTALRLVPLNPAYPERTIPLDQVTGIYPLLYRLLPPRPAVPSTSPAPQGPTSFTTPLNLDND